MLVLPTNLLKNSVTIYLRIQNSHSENFIESYQRYIEILLALKQLITGTIAKKILIDNDIKRLNGAFQKKNLLTTKMSVCWVPSTIYILFVQVIEKYFHNMFWWLSIPLDCEFYRKFLGI